MESHRPQSASARRRSIALRLWLFSLLLLLPLSANAGVKSQAATPPDIPTGFLPGLIHYFAGDGNADNTPVNGSIPTLVSIPQLGAPASDSQGNIYFSSVGNLYVVYAGGPVPKTLQNITGSPTPGAIYLLTPTAPLCGQTLDPTCGEGQPLNLATFGAISAIAFDGVDNLYISDGTSSVIRKVDAKTSNVTTIAGQLNNLGFSGDGGAATGATLDIPYDIKLDRFGNVFIDEQFGTAVRVVYSGTAPPAILAAEGISGPAAQPGTINTIAGQATAFCPSAPTTGSNGSPGACGDYGPATGSTAFFFGLNSIEVDLAGNVYFADAYVGPPAASYIRVVYAGGTVPPILSLALGEAAPTPGYIYAATGYGAGTQFALCSNKPCGDGGLAPDMELGSGSYYLFLRLDALGNLYIADSSDYAIRKLDTSGYASSIAGSANPMPDAPPAFLPPDGGAATGTQMTNSEAGIVFDPANNLYITDNGFPVVWQVSPLLAQTIDFPSLDAVTYGTGAIDLGATATSGLMVSYVVQSGPGKIKGSQMTVTGAGNIIVTASQRGNAQYAAAPPVSVTLPVDPAALSVTAVNASKKIGEANPAFSFSLTGLVNGDKQTTSGVYSGAPTFSTTATTNSPQGTYPLSISIGTLTSKNYSFTSFVDGTLQITGNTSQTITFSAPAPVTYGQTSTVSLVATASSGLPVSFAVVSGPGKISGSTLSITGGGMIVISASQEGSGPYEAANPVTQTLTVNPAVLTVTGPTVTQVYNTPINVGAFPPATITGFVGADTQSSIVSGSAQYTTVSGTPDVGAYPIKTGLGTLALLPGAAGSYVLTPVNGSLKITPAAQTIALNPLPSAQVYGNSLALTAVASSGLPVTFTSAGSAYFPHGNTTSGSTGTVVLQLTGLGSVTATATQAGTGNYLPALPVTQTFNVGQAPLSIGVANQYAREQGAQNPTFQPFIGAPAGQFGSFVNGDADIPSVITGLPLLSTSATPDSPPGSYDIVPSQGTLAAPNYYFVFVTGTGKLTVTPPGSFTLSADQPSLTVGRGLTVQTSLTITPVNVYQGTVTLSCGQLPPNVTCVISPSTYIFPGAQTINGSENNAQGTLTITAAAGTIVGSVSGDNSIRTAATALVPATLAGLFIAFTRRRAAKHSRIWGAVAWFALGVSTLAITSCASSPKMSTAAPGTATVMITASGTTVTGVGTVSASLPIGVTVQ